MPRSNDSYAWSGHFNVDRSYTANGLNQLTAAGATSLGYDARGNLTSSGGNTYTYSELNELKTAPGAALTYGPLGRLIDYAAAASVRFAYDGGMIATEVANPSGAILRRYVPGPGTDERVVWYEGAGTSDRRWLHADERGSVVAGARCHVPGQPWSRCSRAREPVRTSPENRVRASARQDLAVSAGRRAGLLAGRRALVRGGW